MARKKRAIVLSASAAACSIALMALKPANAALYWDTNGANPGSGGPTPAGTWDNTTSNWSADSTGNSPTQLWTPGQSAVFSADSDATGQFTVLLSGTQTASGLNFQTGQTVLSSSGGINLTGGGISVSKGANAALQLVVSGSAGLAVSGSGFLDLPSANTYTGATSITGNTGVSVESNASLGSSSGVSVAAGSTLIVNGLGMNIPTPITSLAGEVAPSVGALRNGIFNNTYAGNITLGSSARVTSTSGTLTLSGTINGNGQLNISGNGPIIIAGSIQTGSNGLAKSDSGLLTLSGSGTNTGAYTINGGTIKLAANERIADTAPLVVGANQITGATLDMAGFHENVGSLSGAGKIINTGEFAVGGDGTTTTFTGTIAGSGTFTKLGTGLLRLTGSNTYTGVTLVTAGTLLVGSNGLGATDNGTVVRVGATVNIIDNATVAEPFTLNGNGVNNGGALRKLSNDVSTYSGPITSNGARINGESGVLRVTGPINNGGFELRLGGAGTASYSGVISGSGPLVKDGSGTATLNGTNTYTGSTTIFAGKLLINSPGSITSPVTVDSGGTLGGTGTINNSVFILPGGHLAPGASPGTLTLGGNLTLASAAALAFELGPVNASDKISMTTRILHLNGQQFSDFTFTRVTGFAADMYTLIDAAGIDGSLGANVSGMIGDTPATLSIEGNDLVLTTTPEPGSLLLAAAGLGALSVVRRRRASAVFLLSHRERVG